MMRRVRIPNYRFGRACATRTPQDGVPTNALLRRESEWSSTIVCGDRFVCPAVRVWRVSRSARSPNLLSCSPCTLVSCRRAIRVRCENYGKIILECGVHRFDYEIFQTLADIGCLHSGNVVLMISDDRLNRGSFFLGSHAGTYGVRFCPSNQKFLSS